MNKGRWLLPLCFFLFAHTSFAEEAAIALQEAAPHLNGEPYITLNAGGSWLDSTLKTGSNLNELHVKYKTGFFGSAAIGFRSGAMKYQLEYMNIRYKHEQFKLDNAVTDESGDLRLQAGLFDFYYLFSHELDFVQPYLGGGIGFGYLKSSGHNAVNGVTLDTQNSDTKFTWFGAAGMNFNFYPRWDLLVEYRYVGTNKADHSIGDHLDADVALLGLTYNF